MKDKLFFIIYSSNHLKLRNMILSNIKCIPIILSHTHKYTKLFLKKDYEHFEIMQYKLYIIITKTFFYYVNKIVEHEVYLNIDFIIIIIFIII